MSIFKYRSNNEELGDTLVENLFISEYMPKAPGNYVKVYLLGLRYSRSLSSNYLSNEIVARTLDMTPEEVQAAWVYWEQQGVMKLYRYAAEADKDDLIVEFLSIREAILKIKGTPKEVAKNDAGRVKNHENDPRVRQMFKSIEKIKGLPLSPTEMFMYLDCLDEYNMPPELVVKIVEYCYEKDIRQPSYFKQTAKGWHEDGIDTLEKALEYLQHHKDKWKKYNKVSKFFKMQNPINEVQEKYLHKWFYELGYSDEIVLKACEQTGKSLNPDFAKIDRYITNWFENGLKTMEDIEAYILKTSKEYKKNTSQSSEKKPSFNNFENRTYDTKRLKEQLLKKSRGELSE